MRSEIFMVVCIPIMVFWGVTPGTFMSEYYSFGGTSCLIFQNFTAFWYCVSSTFIRNTIFKMAPFSCSACTFSQKITWRHNRQDHTLNITWRHIQQDHSLKLTWRHNRQDHTMNITWRHIRQDNSLKITWHHNGQSHNLKFIKVGHVIQPLLIAHKRRPALYIRSVTIAYDSAVMTDGIRINTAATDYTSLTSLDLPPPTHWRSNLSDTHVHRQ